MRTICVTCGVAYRPAKIGIQVVEYFEGGTRPYRLWNADLLECPKCHHQIVDGFGEKARHHLEEGFDKAVAKALEGGAIKWI